MNRAKAAAWIWCMLIAMFLLSPGSGAAAGAAGPVADWKTGLGYAENKLYLDAIAYFTRAIQKNTGEIAVPDVARIFHSRGLAYLALNDPDKALENFSNAIELDDRNPEFFMDRAGVFVGRKQYGRARDDFSAVIKLDPRRTAAYAGRAAANAETGALSGAIADYRKMLELEPRSIAALYGLGLAYKKDKQDAKAIETFNELLAVDPRYAAASYQIAGLFSRAGKIDAGCVWLEEAAANGFNDWDAIKNDPDLDPLRKTRCYQQIMGRR